MGSLKRYILRKSLSLFTCASLAIGDLRVAAYHEQALILLKHLLILVHYFLDRYSIQSSIYIWCCLGLLIEVYHQSLVRLIVGSLILDLYHIFIGLNLLNSENLPIFAICKLYLLVLDEVVCAAEN